MGLIYYICLTFITIGLTAILRIIQLRSYIKLHLFLGMFLPLFIMGSVIWLIGMSNIIAPSLFLTLGKPMAILSFIGLLSGYGCLYMMKR